MEVLGGVGGPWGGLRGIEAGEGGGLGSWGGFGGAWGGSLIPPPPPSAVRARLYAVLELWVQSAGAAGGVLQGPGPPSEELLAHIMADITPPTAGTAVRPPHTAPYNHIEPH